jgi:branched-chain amino acid transport system permease protein
MAEFIQLLIGSITSGILYGVVAIGFVLLWQTSQTINFAQGDFAMVPMFVMLGLYVVAGLPFWISFLITMVASGLMGYLFESLLVRKLWDGGVLVIIVGTLGLSGILVNGMQIIATPQTLFFPPNFSQDPIEILGIHYTHEDIGNLVVIAGMVLSLHFWLKKSRMGKAMQAVAQSRETAVLMGIDVQRIIILVFVLNSVIAGVAGVLAAPVFFVSCRVGGYLGIKAFMAAVIGGFNRVQGALVGGLAIGLAETFSAAYISTAYRDVFALILLVIVLLIKPEGILGIKEEAY